ncbi:MULTISPECIES: ABC transporter permease [unclassified Romboutsia]|uniref:ABC transporter permease n=1 Tax=unclassified Romboutsia TaxID=2626894 RepID=UPI0008232C8D|nr:MULTISPECIES: ABC transporter permease subunit [unclassified Romboutsia]SCI19950.1 Molybdenum transport system permease protein modB [uncultured Clostridium sp.]
MKRNIRKLIIDILLISIITPIFILGVWCFTNSWTYPDLLPKTYSIRGFEYILNKSNLKILVNSILISLVIVFITIIISIPSAKAIAIYNFKGKRLFELLILSPIIIPMVSVAMGIHITFIRMKIANTLVGVIIINIIPCIPYAVRIIGDVYKLVGNKLEIQGQLLGANKFNVFRYITLPLIMPGIIGASSMCFIISFSQYFLTMLIGGGNIITYPMIMFPYIQSGDRNISALYSIVFLIVSIMLLILIEKRIKKYYMNNEETTYLI